MSVLCVPFSALLVKNISTKYSSSKNHRGNQPTHSLSSRKKAMIRGDGSIKILRRTDTVYGNDKYFEINTRACISLFFNIAILLLLLHPFNVFPGQ